MGPVLARAPRAHPPPPARPAPRSNRRAQIEAGKLSAQHLILAEAACECADAAGKALPESTADILLRYIEAQRCAKIGVAQIIGGTVVHVWPDSVAAADEENQVPKVKRLRRGAKYKPLQALYG